MTKEAFENTIAVNTAIGGSTNAVIHLIAIAKHIGVPLDCDDWERVGYKLPLIVNVQPAGEWCVCLLAKTIKRLMYTVRLCEEYHRAGGLPAVIAEMLRGNILPYPDAATVSGKSIGDNCQGKFTWDDRVILPVDKPMMQDAGFLHLKGTLFDSAIMKSEL